jgi:hypothetical protein
MKSRHSNMLAMAHSLRTQAEPRIVRNMVTGSSRTATDNIGQYYRPYDLTREQEDVIDDQIKDAKAVIQREVEEFNLRREQHMKQYGRGRPSTARGETMSSAAAPGDADSSATLSRPTNGSSTQASRHGPDKVSHDEGDVVVEADEDMVIY